MANGTLITSNEFIITKQNTTPSEENAIVALGFGMLVVIAAVAYCLTGFSFL